MQVVNTQTKLLAINAAIEAGKRIMEIYEKPQTDWHVEIKSDNSPLTLADKSSNEIIVNHLRTTHLPILSEETRLENYSERKSWSQLWIVDPLDGTKEFIKRNGEFTVNIALVDGIVPIFGIVFVPATGVLYIGEADKGAWRVEIDCNKQFADWQEVVSTSQTIPLASASHSDKVYVVSRSHIDERTQRMINGKRTVTTGSSIKICLLAEGTADYYPRFAPTCEWDTAAGDAVLRAAGGMLYIANEENDTTHKMTPLKYNKENILNPFFLGYAVKE